MRFVSWLEVVLISSKDFSQHGLLDPSKRCRILSGQVRDSLIRGLKGLTSRRAPTAFEDSQPKFRQLLRISRKIIWNQIERHLFIFLLLAVLIRFQNYFLPAKKHKRKQKSVFWEKKLTSNTKTKKSPTFPPWVRFTIIQTEKKSSKSLKLLFTFRRFSKTFTWPRCWSCFRHRRSAHSRSGEVARAKNSKFRTRLTATFCSAPPGPRPWWSRRRTSKRGPEGKRGSRKRSWPSGRGRRGRRWATPSWRGRCRLCCPQNLTRWSSARRHRNSWNLSTKTLWDKPRPEHLCYLRRFEELVLDLILLNTIVMKSQN